MSRKFFVVGGEFADERFFDLAEGCAEESFGPFAERDAHECWRALTSKCVDKPMVRYFIRGQSDSGGGLWFVVGGQYGSADFTHLAAGQPLEVYGPFSRKQAMGRWRELNAAALPSRFVRYELCTSEVLGTGKG
jgi:hypothetical protein